MTWLWRYRNLLIPLIAFLIPAAVGWWQVQRQSAQIADLLSRYQDTHNRMVQAEATVRIDSVTAARQAEIIVTTRATMVRLERENSKLASALREAERQYGMTQSELQSVVTAHIQAEEVIHNLRTRLAAPVDTDAVGTYRITSERPLVTAFRDTVSGIVVRGETRFPPATTDIGLTVLPFEMSVAMSRSQIGEWAAVVQSSNSLFRPADVRAYVAEDAFGGAVAAPGGAYRHFWVSGIYQMPYAGGMRCGASVWRIRPFAEIMLYPREERVTGRVGTELMIWGR